jgi:serine/threonine-protein kinase
MNKPPSHSDLDLRPGQLLEGKYRVERILGAGGMGVVVAAHHMQLDEKVAIKFLHPRAVRDQEAMARFLREARAAVKIKSEHVARVLDVGSLSSGEPFMVMEYLEGTDLAKQIRRTGALPVSQAVDFVLQTCDAIANAHAIGIVHRDLKPANLFCIRASDRSLSIKVLDFGISKLTQEAAMRTPDGVLTSTQAVMGSPHYMSPEQMQSSKAVDARADIWSLGAILFELLTGRVPFDAATVPELVIKIVTQPAPSVRSLSPDVPEGLAAIVSRCLEKDRERRYANVGLFARALIEFAPAHARPLIDRIDRVVRFASAPGVQGNPPPAENTTEPMGDPLTEAPWGRTSREKNEKRGTTTRRTVALSAAGVLLVGLVGALPLIRRAASVRHEPTMGSAPTASGIPEPPLAAAPPSITAVAPSASASAAPAPVVSPTPLDSVATTLAPSASTPPPPPPRPARPVAPAQPPPRPKSNVYNEM